jgi:hypothetical protein
MEERVINIRSFQPDQAFEKSGNTNNALNNSDLER